MSQIRSNNLYISSQLHRWLKWVSEMDPDAKATPDSIAEGMLRGSFKDIFKDWDKFEKAEADYWTARNKLDSETVNKLKAQTAKTDKPM